MASRDPQRPNVLFILSDDQGAWAMRCAGNAEILTPNLDAHRRRGHPLHRFLLHVAGVLAGARVAA